ncbi:MAG: hypothetical protein IT292_07860 [Deltaproteobacteria bacterium]|nr:hypothetical protein [Deltaproteobacteria bacterium]
MKNIMLIFAMALLLTGCNSGFQKMEAGEYGVRFRALPAMLGGGISKNVIAPGEMEFIYPWETIYRVDTTVQSIGWGGMNQGENKSQADYIHTRAKDGNEVGLAINTQFHIDPKMVSHVVQYVGIDKVKPLVAAVARADVRTHMNALYTSGFINPNERSEVLKAVKHAINHRLSREGIIIDEVIYVDHRFERKLADGQIVDKYQQIIDNTQAKRQEVLREPKQREAQIKDKEKAFFDAQANVNKLLEEAKGYEAQASMRGENYLKEKQNVADQILATGLAEVEGLKKQVAALSGEGGKALLRLSIARELAQNDAKFVMLNTGDKGNAFDVNRVDSNELIRQMGLATMAQEAVKTEKENEKK